jgi:hypothetical protein
LLEDTRKPAKELVLEKKQVIIDGRKCNEEDHSKRDHIHTYGLESSSTPAQSELLVCPDCMLILLYGIPEGLSQAGISCSALCRNIMSPVRSYELSSPPNNLMVVSKTLAS